MAKAPPKQALKAKKTPAKKPAAAPRHIQPQPPVVAAKPVAVKPMPKEVASRAHYLEKKTSPYFYANGKRKTSVAMVRLHSNGKGTFVINERTLENYFPVATDQDKILSPLRIANALKSFDISVKVYGGGIHSQAEAVRHGISKALLEFDAGLRTSLKPVGFLTRDSRVKERKKYGLHRARRGPQFSKR